MSSEIDRVARTCNVIEYNGMAMRLPVRVSGASIGPLGDGATCDCHQRMWLSPG